MAKKPSRAQVPLPFASPAEPTGATARVAVPAGPPLEGRTVYLVDAHSLIFQVFHAIPEMSGPHGQPVGAVFGFARDLFYLIEQKRPDYLFCALDESGPTFRHGIYAPYKADRGEMPETLRAQIPTIRRLLETLGIPAVTYPGHEADDVIATMARQVEARGGRCLVVTGDKDCRQLISDKVQLFNIRKDQVLDAQAVRDQWGIEPSQVIDFQTLVGDPVDNIPGVPLIGPKIASQLLNAYGTLEGIYAHLDQLPAGKRRENLVAFREQTCVSRQLVRLVDDLPLEIDWQAGCVGQFDHQRGLELFRELGFRGLAQRLTELVQGEEAAEPRRATARDYHLVDSFDKLHQLAEALGAQKAFAIDTETTDIRARWARLVGLSFSWEAGEAYYVPVLAPAGQAQLPWEQVRAVLQPALEDPGIRKYGQNLKYDWIVLRAHGVQLQGIHFDSMVASYVLDAGQRSHALDDLAKRYLDVVPIPISRLIGKGCAAQSLDQVDVQLVCEYAAEDADLSWQLGEILSRRLADEGLEELFYDLEMPLVPILGLLEFTGMAVDVPALETLSGEFDRQLKILEQEIHELAGRPFNLGSPRQLAEVLFQELGLPVVKRTKTGPSTDVEVLEQLAHVHPLPAKVIEHRQYAKLKGTYVDALPQMVHPTTRRIHSSLNQVVTATGRLSSNDPNLQNIPVRTEQGRRIRAAFVPEPREGYLLSADYSQIELRVLAHFSQDPRLLEAFDRDADIHAQVASEVYQVPRDQVTSPMRRTAKVINFGIVYGQSPFGLSKVLGIDAERAGAYIDLYYRRHPGVEEFLENLLEDCLQNGYVTSIFGRRRRIVGVREPSRRGLSRQRTLPERTAINTVIQGSAADLIKKAMIQVHRRLARELPDARMLLQIHDELLFEVPRESLDSLAHMVSEEMTQVADLRVPLKVDIQYGANWAEGQDWSPSRGA